MRVCLLAVVLFLSSCVPLLQKTINLEGNRLVCYRIKTGMAANLTGASGEALTIKVPESVNLDIEIVKYLIENCP